MSTAKTREEVVADGLRSAIVRGMFKPGDKLDQGELSERLGVSRSSLREALRTLAAEEFVTIVPHRGVVVTERTDAELQELLFIRTMLEGAAARRAVEAMTDERLSQIEHVLIQGEASSDMEEVLALNNQFHTLIYETYPQPIMVSTIQQLRNKIAPCNRLYLDAEGRKEAAWVDHRRISWPVARARNADAVEDETQRHLQQVFEGIDRIFSIKRDKP